MWPPSRIGLTGALATIASVMVLTIATTAVIVAFDESSQAARDHRVDSAVNALLVGIPQSGNTLGKASAPFTLQVFADLECHDSRYWFKKYLPAIISRLVRPGILKIQYRSFKTDTIWPTIFVNQQTAALAAGAQGKMWNYIETFYHEQGVEYTQYATEGYLDNIAQQIQGMQLGQWRRDRKDGRRSEQVAADDHEARTLLGFHTTPAFLIGRTGERLHSIVGSKLLIDVGKKRNTKVVTLQNILAVIEALRGGDGVRVARKAAK